MNEIYQKLVFGLSREINSISLEKHFLQENHIGYMLSHHSYIVNYY